MDITKEFSDLTRESSAVENRARKNEVEYLKGFYKFAVDAYHESDCFPVEVFIEKELGGVAERYMDSRHYSAEAKHNRLFDLSEDTAEKFGNLLNRARENIKDYMAKTTHADSECCCSESILEEAQRIVHGERQTDYDDPVINFKRISDIASAVRGKDLDMIDCVTVQIATKLARQQNKHKRDNLVDLAGYTYIWHAIEECIANEKDKIEPPKGIPYCYTYTDKYRECKHYKHIEGLEGYCRLLKCEVLDQVKECDY